jgi:D-alanyl-D-alanine dipeptidase
MLNKILFSFYILNSCASVFQGASAQALSTSSYGVPVMRSYAGYLSSIKKDSLKKLTELRTLNKRIRYDLRYAGNNNFIHKKMYPGTVRKTFLRAPAALALAHVQKELETKGLGLKIFDAYRPYSVSVKFWELVKDERYVANPSKGSAHNRGLAVDLTLVDLKSGKELDMGTGFDNFSDSAHHDFKGLPQKVLDNRVFLRKLMEQQGFNALETEWWHYYWRNDRGYEVLDIVVKGE